MVETNRMKVEIRGCKFEVETGTTAYDVTHWSWINAKKWEEPTFDVLTEFLDKDHSYIDIGAHIGMTALYGSARSKHCYAIEPDIIASNALKSNVALNGIQNITVYEMAISDENGKAMLNVSDGGNSMSSMLVGKGLKKEVVCKTLGSFIVDEKITDCNFIKMDVEGSELKILPQIKDLFSILDISLYVSIHAMFFTEREKSLRIIADALSNYKHLYIGGKEIKVGDIEKLTGLGDILCTNKEVK